MKKYNLIHQMVISGVLTGVAILIGAFTNFTVIGQVYLVAAIVFIMPLFLRLDFLLIAAITSVAISDVISGNAYIAWISAIVYGIAMIILWAFSKLQFKIAFHIGMIIAAIFIVLGYFFIEWPVYGKAFALKDLVATPIEMLICISIASVLYFPMKVVSKSIKK